jgi:hypothetical protein
VFSLLSKIDIPIFFFAEKRPLSGSTKNSNKTKKAKIVKFDYTAQSEEEIMVCTCVLWCMWGVWCSGIVCVCVCEFEFGLYVYVCVCLLVYHD